MLPNESICINVDVGLIPHVNNRILFQNLKDVQKFRKNATSCARRFLSRIINRVRIKYDMNHNLK